MAKIKKDEESPVYDFDSLMKAERYAGVKDILLTVVGKDELLTLEEVDGRINSFLEREVQ